MVAESEALSQREADSPIPPDHTNAKTHNSGNDNNNYAFPTLGRSSSIYSLTLDEFQHTLCENGKNFGSMNMDEFLNSIWTAEENQAHQTSQNEGNHQHSSHHNHGNVHFSMDNVALATSRGIAKQPSLPRQGSLSLPAPLCGKTVDEVWSEIQRSQQQNEQQQQRQAPSSSNSAQRQPTFGEMTLEDFLIKAGVVREQCTTSAAPAALPPAHHHHHHPQPQHHQYRYTGPQVAPAFANQPMMGMVPGTGVAGYQPLAPNGGESSGYGASGKRNNGYHPPPVGAACYAGGRVNNGVAPGGGYGAGLSPVSPASDGICGPGQVDDAEGQYGRDMALRGRKRMIDGPMEKVVERRQRRMIKNRESAARSRARKQAYTVELEAELNQLREENSQLKQALGEMERRRKQQYQEEQKVEALTRAQRAQEKLRAMKRTRSCAL